MTGDSNPVTHRPPLRVDAVQLFVLNGFAIAQPLFQAIADQATFLVRQQIDAVGLSLVIAALMLGAPSMLLGLEMLIGQACGHGMRRKLHRGIVLLLVLSLTLQVFEAFLKSTELQSWGVPGPFTLALALPTAFYAARWIEYSNYARKLVVYALAGLVLFPAMFCRRPGVWEVFVPPAGSDPPVVLNPVPIVMVVFDGFNGMSLLDEQHAIDASRYPNFARLASMSDWYRNATTVHPRTAYAVPALLTGNLPREVLPLASEYPHNLFALLHESGQYELTVFEPGTNLSPRGIEQRLVQLPPLQQAALTLWHLQFVFWNATLPDDVFPTMQDIPRSWFGLSQEINVADSDDVAGAFHYSWDVQRPDQFELFLNTLRSSDIPAFRFLHLVMPHHPWNYLPDGTCYAPQMDVGTIPLGAHGFLGEDWSDDPLIVQLAWQRYLLQVMFVDTLIGRLLDELEASGLLHECLLVVTADHGEAFVPGVSRREPVDANLSQILPIPLFIKLPGQRTGSVSDENVESIDVFPTIADVIGLQLYHEVEGRAIFDPEFTPRLRKTFLSNWQPTGVSAEFPERYRSVDRMIELFGTGSNNDRVESFSYMPELVGQPLTQFTIDEADQSVVSLTSGSRVYDAAVPDVRNCLFEGRVLGMHESDPPRTVVISLNGSIVGVTRTLQDAVLAGHFSVLASRAEFHNGNNDLRIFLLSTNAGKPVLESCHIQQPD